MRWKNKKDFQAYCKRRSERMSRLGQELEKQVENILLQMWEERLICAFAHNPANSLEDSQGKDFSVTQETGGEETVRHFGVTISMRSWQKAKGKHEDVPQFHFPIGTNKKTIEKRILELFQS